MTKFIMRRRATFTSFLCAASAISSAVAAQTSETTAEVNSPHGLVDQGEIVVTASKSGEERLSKIPLSIQAITGTSLQRQGAVEINDILRQVPSFAVFDAGPGDKRYIIRGINSAGASTVGVYVDEAVITDENSQDGGGRAPDIRLFDLQRVEILKGPQGTTFGSSSLSGVIRYITNKPELGIVSGSARTALNLQRHADLGFTSDAAINLPIVNDKLAVRVSGYYENLPGFIDSQYDDGVNGVEAWAFRAQTRAMLADNIQLDAFVMRQKASADGRQGYNLNDYAGNSLPPREQAILAREPYNDTIWIYGGTLEADLSIGKVTLVASREERTSVINRDASEVLGKIFGFDPATPGVRSVISAPKKRSLESYEVRYASNRGGAIEFLVGGFVQRERRNYVSAIYTVNPRGEIDPTQGVLFGPVIQDRSLRTSIDEIAAFGEISWRPVQGLKLTAGGRVFQIKNKSIPTATIGIPGVPASGEGETARAKESSAIGRLNASYEFNDQIMGYVQVAQGYRAGGTNDQAAAELLGIEIPVQYNSDSLVNYEIGIKGSTDDRVLNWSVSAYYIDWSDLQLSLQAFNPDNPSQSYGYVGNAGGAGSYGLEVELGVRPVQGLSIGLSGAFTDTRITKATVSGGAEDDRVPYIPRYTATLSADYEIPLASDMTFFVGGDVNFVGARYTDLPGNLSNYHRLGAYQLANAHIGVEKDGWRLSAILKNVTNDDTVIDQNQTIPGLTVTNYMPNRPRTVLFQVEKKF